ncbi:MAG TPA: molybdopterin-dependent oxidoreductase, partial [Gammaproteobacteria bacterium]|nr:molybdopterin-dependent oxidoreductase [Gammaproteobacteria bacterium]
LLAQRHPGFGDLRVLAMALCRRTGATLGYLGEGANSAGACLAGVLPHRAAGGSPVAAPGLDAAAMLAGGLDAMVLLGLEPEHDSAGGAAALEGLQRCGFVVCLTPYATPAMKAYADVLLPVGTAYETSGTFVNCEGRRQSFAGAARPVGEARPAWKVLRVLANQLGLADFEYQSSEDVRDALLAELGDRESGDLAGSPDVPLRAVALRHEGGVQAPGVYATDMLLRRSRPLQDTAAGRAGGRRLA